MIGVLVNKIIYTGMNSLNCQMMGSSESWAFGRRKKRILATEVF